VRKSSKLAELFGADLRSLAFFRIAVSCVILGDLTVRGMSLRAHYTDFGVLPRTALIDQFSPLWRLSLHFMSGQPAVQLALFILAGLFAVMMLVGYRTRLATFLSWAMMTSLHARNPMVLQAGDVFLHMLLFWGMFMPLGARASLDSFLKPAREPLPKSFASMGTAGLVMQVAFVYWFSVGTKLNPNSFPIWWNQGTAVYYALSIDEFATPIAHFLLHFPLLLKGLDYMTLAVEIFAPLMLLCPVATGPIRTLAVFMVIGMHVGFRLCLELGPFPWISSAAMLALLPAFFWDQIVFRFKWESIVSGFSGISKKICGSGWLPPPHLPNIWRPTLWGNTIAFFCLVYIFTWNLGNLYPRLATPPFLRWFGVLTSIDQKWDMFSPPLRDDGWYVIPGRLRNGAVVDIFKNGGPVSWEKPKMVSATYPSERWRKYLMNLYLSSNHGHRLYYGKYLCRDWNERHPKDLQLMEFEIYFMRETTRPNYEKPQVEKVSLWRHWCFEVPKEALSREATLGL